MNYVKKSFLFMILAIWAGSYAKTFDIARGNQIFTVKILSGSESKNYVSQIRPENLLSPKEIKACRTMMFEITYLTSDSKQRTITLPADTWAYYVETIPFEERDTDNALFEILSYLTSAILHEDGEIAGQNHSKPEVKQK